MLDYSDYGPGRELRELVDQIADARRRLLWLAGAIGETTNEVERIEKVVAAKAEEARREHLLRDDAIKRSVEELRKMKADPRD